MDGGERLEANDRRAEGQGGRDNTIKEMEDEIQRSSAEEQTAHNNLLLPPPHACSNEGGGIMLGGGSLSDCSACNRKLKSLAVFYLLTLSLTSFLLLPSSLLPIFPFTKTDRTSDACESKDERPARELGGIECFFFPECEVNE